MLTAARERGVGVSEAVSDNHAATLVVGPHSSPERAYVITARALPLAEPSQGLRSYSSRRNDGTSSESPASK